MNETTNEQEVLLLRRKLDLLFTLTGNRLFFRDAKVQKVYDIHN